MALLSFSGSPHGGRLRLLPEWQSQPKITPTTIIDHSIVGSALGAYLFFRDKTGIESHFIVDLNGEIWQLMDTGRQADANLEANRYAISIETADNGNPDTFAWTSQQLASLKWLHNKLRAVHPTIPKKKATSCTSGGLGFHSQMGAPSCWTSAVGKTCPGKPERVSQWNEILVPAFISGEVVEEDDFMALFANEQEFQDSIREVVKAEVDRVYRLETDGTGGGDEHIQKSIVGVGDEVKEKVEAMYRLIARGQYEDGSTDPASSHYKDSNRNLCDLLNRVLDLLTTPPTS